jgi:hypothetical protein
VVAQAGGAQVLPHHDRLRHGCDARDARRNRSGRKEGKWTQQRKIAHRGGRAEGGRLPDADAPYRREKHQLRQQPQEVWRVAEQGRRENEREDEARRGHETKRGVPTATPHAHAAAAPAATTWSALVTKLTEAR